MQFIFKNTVKRGVMQKIRIIIVENHRLMREALQYVLNNDENIEVVGSCALHDEAIGLCISERPDVVLFSIGMNLQNDFTAISHILMEFPEIRIIGMSVSSRPVLAETVLNAGAHGFVTKSSSKEEMVEAILKVCGGQTYICNEVRELTY